MYVVNKLPSPKSQAVSAGKPLKSPLPLVKTHNEARLPARLKARNEGHPAQGIYRLEVLRPVR